MYHDIIAIISDFLTENKYLLEFDFRCKSNDEVDYSILFRALALTTSEVINCNVQNHFDDVLLLESVKLLGVKNSSVRSLNIHTLVNYLSTNNVIKPLLVIVYLYMTDIVDMRKLACQTIGTLMMEIYTIISFKIKYRKKVAPHKIDFSMDCRGSYDDCICIKNITRRNKDIFKKISFVRTKAILN